MSMNANYYVIVGYDLTNWKTDKYKDWRWTDEGEEFTCYQSKGHIQLFDDPMSGNHLYLGYVLANGDEYEFKTSKINTWELTEVEPEVLYSLKHLIDIGIINKNIFISKDFKYEIIVFEECT